MKAILRVGYLSIASLVLAECNVKGVRVYFANLNYPHIKISVKSWDELNVVVRKINEAKGYCSILRVKEDHCK